MHTPACLSKGQQNVQVENFLKFTKANQISFNSVCTNTYSSEIIRVSAIKFVDNVAYNYIKYLVALEFDYTIDKST